MNADAKFDAALRQQTGVMLDHAVCTSTAQRTASTTLRNSTMLPSPVRLTVAVMGGDGGVHEIAAQAAQTRERPLLVRAGEPAIADDVGDPDRRELPGLARCAPPAAGTLAQKPAQPAELR